MDKEKVIQYLWEASGHGTQRKDIEAAYDAGVVAERKACRKICAGLHIATGQAIGDSDEVTEAWNKALRGARREIDERSGKIVNEIHIQE